tara:strand:- start:404 stop:670 length:267 start_codon:yes stop_codon:yes gene_type:complete
MKLLTKNFNTKDHKVIVTTKKDKGFNWIWIDIETPTGYKVGNLDLPKYHCVARLYNDKNFNEKFLEALREAEQYLGVQLVETENLKVA